MASTLQPLASEVFFINPRLEPGVARKTPTDYAIEAARKRPKMQDCRKCGRRVWGGYFEVSWVFMEPINLGPLEEARLIEQGVETWDVRLIYGKWTIDYRTLMHIQHDQRRGYRYLVLASHRCDR